MYCTLYDVVHNLFGRVGFESKNYNICTGRARGSVKFLRVVSFLRSRSRRPSFGNLLLLLLQLLLLDERARTYTYYNAVYTIMFRPKRTLAIRNPFAVSADRVLMDTRRTGLQYETLRVVKVAVVSVRTVYDVKRIRVVHNTYDKSVRRAQCHGVMRW